MKSSVLQHVTSLFVQLSTATRNVFVQLSTATRNVSVCPAQYCNT
jgi:hypothetical protein